MSIDTSKYVNALTKVTSHLDPAAVELCIILALQEQRAQLSPPINWRQAQEERDALVEWLTDHDFGYDGNLLVTVERIVRQLREGNAALLGEIEHLQAEVDKEIADKIGEIAALTRVRAYQRDRIVELTAQTDSLRASVTEQDAEIQIQRAGINRLTAHCQELAEQLEAANSRPVTLNVVASTSTNGTGSAPTPAAQPSTSTGAPAAIDWSGIDPDHRGIIEKLDNGTLPGWTVLPMPQRRAIALYVIGRMADNGNVTGRVFDETRPAWMPTASAITKMFGIQWPDVVTNAIRVAVRDA